MNQKVNFYFEKESRWHAEVAALRDMILDCNLTETLKWGQPCYVLGSSNIVLIHTFKTYCALLFFKGALMKDPQQLLIQQSENVQAARQLRFTSKKEIVSLKSTIKAYVFEAIEIEKAGLKVALKPTAAYNIPDEFKLQLEASKKLKTAFEKLTPGRQRGYLLYFSSAKQVKTREARIQKYIPVILQGKGLEDE
jgi:uncharacterized protein YdeI (YjbR/CyaY-like superfamily)